ncbi:MAG: hypothetical protein K8T91_25895 [Planctomycetes bacterium]|nr:hypothetical protein [Planctomycetota bacterium]
MKPLLVLATISLTIICWGVYGPVLNAGKAGFIAASATEGATGAAPTDAAMRNAALRAFICVGLAYFVIAVLVPITMLQTYGEKGEWSASGMFWSLLAGTAGALGALGVLLALVFGGQPMYVMPLVFGGAPVVNAVLTMYMGKSLKEVGPLFLAGLIMVLLGSIVVLVFGHGKSDAGIVQRMEQLTAVLSAVTLAILSWGAYGPVLHKGQVAMGSSRLRPLICVGLAYFLIAVIVPGLMLAAGDDAGQWRPSGLIWSLAAGSAGAIGALGIIMCFNFGGKPIFVMPLVFGGAPVVNTLVNASKHGGLAGMSPFFYAGLILTCAGAAIVLIFAPRGHAPASPPAKV